MDAAAWHNMGLAAKSLTGRNYSDQEVIEALRMNGLKLTIKNKTTITEWIDAMNWSNGNA